MGVRSARRVLVVASVILAHAHAARPSAAQTAGGGEPPARASNDVEAVLAGHNRERAKDDLPPLTLVPKLTEAAKAHAADMASHAKMTHDGSDGSTAADRVKRQGYTYRRLGENVAEGYTRVDDLMRGWMESPHHKENVLGDFTQVGIASARGSDGKLYWCVDFGAPPPTLDRAHAADDLVKALNKERADADAGLAPLTPREPLAAAASRIADDYAGADSFDLGGRKQDLTGILSGLGYRFSKVGESTAAGQYTASEVMATLMKGPSHKTQVLAADFTEVGVAVAVSPTGRPFWCLILARPAGK